MSQAFGSDELIEVLREQQLLAGEPPAVRVELTGFSPLSDPLPGTLSWARGEVDWESLPVAAVIVGPGVEGPVGGPLAIATSDPRLAFALALRHFALPPAPQGIESDAVVGGECAIDASAYVGHGSVLGSDVRIGPRSVIGSRVTIEDGVEIGADCSIGAGCVIGSPGFGYERDREGRWLRLPHIGGVRIGDRVEVGSNTCIDRGTLGDTVIGDDVKIDNLCHIAHNVEIGAGSLVIALTMVGGSTRIGAGSHVAPAAALRNNLSLGEGAFVGLGAVVTRDVAPGRVVAGVPAKDLRERRPEDR